MTTAGEVLSKFLETCGADAWCGWNNRGEPLLLAEADVHPDARPAWRDGALVDDDETVEIRTNKWFVLPDGWEWNDAGKYFRAFRKGKIWNAEVFCRDGIWGCNFDMEAYQTAPEAFRAAQQWLEQQGRACITCGEPIGVEKPRAVIYCGAECNQQGGA